MIVCSGLEFICSEQTQNRIQQTKYSNGKGPDRSVEIHASKKYVQKREIRR